jgi:hypothetical protein
MGKQSGTSADISAGDLEALEVYACIHLPSSSSGGGAVCKS